MMKILLVDDEISIERLVSSMLLDAGYEFAYADNGFDALAIAEQEKPDLIIMDVMMPKMDGFAACRELRARGITAPIIFLSAKGDIVDKGIGFQAGGDDYMVKPFDPRELLMHIEAHLRRANMGVATASKDEVLDIGRFTLDVAQFRVTKGDERLSLTPKEFKIFFALASNPGIVLSKEQLVEAAWGKEFVGETSSITVFIKKLREKVEDDPSDPRIIQTVWGIGYRLEPEAC
ncbi:response regulator transcription factor [Raoultibacter timonensis]|uniref:DNA-binding response regulator n=1 Tax=Raoultibacter timonensis TaxID=1907662 RepID=A0ABN6MHA9_9ACTN|nr:response regulator transcription factor [Raoultibacter timonensis]BDE97104.1 DNA-binding response regulator [Raoultibacter timonensis]BDF51708.1 DNA-binding response regulator [Raoultibacter timonensis]